MLDSANPLAVEELDPNKLVGIDGYTHEPVKEKVAAKGSLPKPDLVKAADEASRLSPTGEATTSGEAEDEKAEDEKAEDKKVEDKKVEDKKVEDKKVEEPKAPATPSSKK